MVRKGERIEETDTYECVQSLFNYIDLIDGRTKRHATMIRKLAKLLPPEIKKGEKNEVPN